MSVVPVVDLNNEPLMPTTSARANKWFRSGKATAFIRQGVFCLRLNIKPSYDNKPDISFEEILQLARESGNDVKKKQKEERQEQRRINSEFAQHRRRIKEIKRQKAFAKNKAKQKARKTA